MDLINRSKKLSSVLSSLGLAAAGLLFAVFATFVLLAPKAETAAVSAVITDIREIRNREERDYRVTVSYEAAGRTYTAELGAYDSAWEVGDVIACEYEVAHPENISHGSSRMIGFVLLAAGAAVFIFGIWKFLRGIRRPSRDYARYDRVAGPEPGAAASAAAPVSAQALQDYVFHFTGKLNQSFVMKDSRGREVFRADCGGIRLLRDTDYEFVNLQTGSRVSRKIGHTVNLTERSHPLLLPNLQSAFGIDGQGCWDFLADRGFGFSLTPHGLKCRCEVRRYNAAAGFIETAGTEVLQEEPSGNPLAKLPSAGIYRISCRPDEAEDFFYICFCLARTKLTLT